MTMDDLRRTWIDTWESRDASNGIFPGVSQATESLRSPKSCTSRDEVNEVMMDTENKFTTDTANKESVAETGNVAVIRVEAQPRRGGMLISSPVSMQQVVNERTAATELSETRNMQTIMPQSRNQLGESRWATKSQLKGHNPFAKSSAITTNGSRLDTRGKQLPVVQLQKSTLTEQHGHPSRSKELEHDLPLHMRPSLTVSVHSPSANTNPVDEQWSKSNDLDRSSNGMSGDFGSEQKHLLKRTNNTSTPGCNNTALNKGLIRHSVTVCTTSDPPIQKQMLTHREASKNFSPVPNSSSDATRNVFQPENALPQLRTGFSKLPAHLQSFYTKYAAGNHMDIGTRSTVANSNLQIGNGQTSASRGQSKEQTKVMAGKQAVLSTGASQIISNKDTIFAAKANITDYTTQAIPLRSVENNFVFDGTNDSSNAVIKDIRGEEPQETWTQQDWNAPRRARPTRKEWESETNVSGKSGASNKSAFAHPESSLHRYVRFWLNTVPQVKCDFIHSSPGKVYEEHDIDPIDGHLIAPIEAPAVIQNEFGLDDPALNQKFARQTADWSTKRYLDMIARRLKRAEEQEKRRAHERQVREMAEAKANKGNPYLCRVPAHLRPATEGDMEDVARIYNQEVHDGWRVLDEEPQTVATFTQFLRFCRSENIPFLVAMSKYRNPNVPVEEANHRVIGFAFLDIASRGVFGSTRSNGKHSARLYIMVDPPYRRNRVGTALIDRMLVLTSRGYMEKESSYQFENPENDPVYKPELQNPRQWRIIQMEVYIENLGNLAATKAGEEYKAIWDFLEDFAMARHTSNYGVAERHGQKYLDRLLLEHRCRDGDGDWESE